MRTFDTTPTADTTTTTTTNARTRRLAAAVALAALVGSGAAACSSGGVDVSAAGTTQLPIDTTVAPEGGEAEPGGSPQGGGAGGGQSAGGGGGGGGGQSSGGGGGQSGPAPSFTSAYAPDSVDCHNGNVQSFSVSWAAQGATRVTISIDGPGVYASYGPSGEASLPFTCPDTQVVLLTAYSAGGQTATRQFTIGSRNVQEPMQEEDESQVPQEDEEL